LGKLLKLYQSGRVTGGTTFLQKLVQGYRHFEGTCCCDIHCARVGVAESARFFLPIYQTTRRHNLAHRNLDIRRENLKSHVIYSSYIRLSDKWPCASTAECRSFLRSLLLHSRFETMYFTSESELLRCYVVSPGK